MSVLFRGWVWTLVGAALTGAAGLAAADDAPARDRPQPAAGAAKQEPAAVPQPAAAPQPAASPAAGGAGTSRCTAWLTATTSMPTR